MTAHVSFSNQLYIDLGDLCALKTEWFINYAETVFSDKMSRLMRKPTICMCKKKDADQLRGNREADQRLCFRYSGSTIPLLLKSEISSF